MTDIIEVRIGYDGIVFASEIGGNTFEFTPIDWYKALSETLIVDGVAVAIPYTMWNDVNPALPAQPIQAFIPGTKHGTREVFEDKVILAGCEETGDFDILKASLGDDNKAAEKASIGLRTDGKSVDIDRDHTETLARIASNKNGIGVFGLAFTKTTLTSFKSRPCPGFSQALKASRPAHTRCPARCFSTSRKRISG